jgi:hypothetical protein
VLEGGEPHRFVESSEPSAGRVPLRVRPSSARIETEIQGSFRSAARLQRLVMFAAGLFALVSVGAIFLFRGSP